MSNGITLESLAEEVDGLIAKVAALEEAEADKDEKIQDLEDRLYKLESDPGSGFSIEEY